MLESVLPGCKGRLDPSKVFIIPFLPDPPGHHHEHLHEHVSIPSVFTSMQKCEPAVPNWPMNPNTVPTSFTEGTVKEEVSNVLFRWVLTEQEGIIIILYFIVPPSQHISGVQTIG